MELILKVWLVGVISFLVLLGVIQLKELSVSSGEAIIVLLFNWLLVLLGGVQQLLETMANNKVRRDFNMPKGSSFSGEYLMAYGVTLTDKRLYQNLKVIFTKRDKDKLPERLKKKEQNNA